MNKKDMFGMVGMVEYHSWVQDTGDTKRGQNGG